MSFTIKTISTPIDKPDLYISASSDVEASDYQIILDAIRRISNEVKSKLRHQSFGAFNYSNEEYGSADWYIEHCRLSNGQVDAEKLLGLFREEPYQTKAPHKDVFITDQDLTFPSTHFVFGASNCGNMVLSTHRFKDLESRQKQKVLQLLSAHEMGHIFGLVTRANNAHEALGRHCLGEKGACLMEQMNVRGCKTIERLSNLVIPHRNWLCEDCQREIAQHRTKAEITF